MRSRRSEIVEIKGPWKPRRNRRNRKWKGGPRKIQAWSTKIIKLLEDDDLNGRNSPCSVVSVSLSLDEEGYGNSEWIRTAHIKAPNVNEQDRRSPLFTGRMLRRNNFSDDIHGARKELSYELPSEVGRNRNTARLSIRERLEPPPDDSPDLGISPRFASPEMDIRHRYMTIRQRMEPPMTITSRETIGAVATPEQFAFRPNQPEKEPASQPHPRSISDEYDGYSADRFLRNGFSLPQRPRCFRRSLYYPPGYTSPLSQQNQREPTRRQRIWPWLKTSPDHDASDIPPDRYAARRDCEDYDIERLTRDTFLAPEERHYDEPEYYDQPYLDQSTNNLREPGSLPSHQVNEYPDYRAGAYEINYNNRRNDERFDCSFSQVESYGPSFSPQRFYSSWPPGSQYTPRYRSLMEPSSGNWGAPPARDYHCSYQDRIPDEDFIDSDETDPEAEVADDKPKKEEQQMWKQLVKERGVLVSRDGDTAAMTKECAQHVKNILIKKASNSTEFPQSWKPRFLRTGFVHRSGLYQIICKDDQTVKWTLEQEIPPFEGSGFKLLKRPYDWDCGPVRISLWIASEPANPQDALRSLEAENPGIGATGWRLVSVSFQDGWRQFVADVNRETSLYLESNGWTVLFWNNLLPVIRLRNASNQLFFNQLAGHNL